MTRLKYEQTSRGRTPAGAETRAALMTLVQKKVDERVTRKVNTIVP